MGWEYKKHDDGIMEAWIFLNFTYSATTQWGSSGIYYGILTSSSIPNYPVPFVEYPVVTIYLASNSFWGGHNNGISRSLTTPVPDGLLIYRVGSATNYHFNLNIRAIGRWK